MFSLVVSSGLVIVSLLTVLEWVRPGVGFRVTLFFLGGSLVIGIGARAVAAIAGRMRHCAPCTVSVFGIAVGLALALAAGFILLVDEHHALGLALLLSGGIPTAMLAGMLVPGPPRRWGAWLPTSLGPSILFGCLAVLFWAAIYLTASGEVITAVLSVLGVCSLVAGVLPALGCHE